MAAPNTFFAARHLCTDSESLCLETGLEGRSAVLYITSGCGEATWAEMPTSLATCPGPSHFPCQVRWKLYLHGIFLEKRAPMCLKNSPAMQANVSALSLSDMLWLNLACLADLKALQEDGACPCPALVIFCRADTLTPSPHPCSLSSSHVIWRDHSHPRIPPQKTEQETSPYRHPGLQTG